jgi:hypothetical protein
MGRAQIRYPLKSVARIAVFDAAAVFDPQDAETAAFPARLLPHVWSSAWTPSYPVMIFTGPAHGLLTEADRERVWRRWGVPVYEQRLDAEGGVVAEECDAHEGLHLLVAPGSWDGPVEHRLCGCGIEGPMIPDRVPSLTAV